MVITGLLPATARGHYGHHWIVTCHSARTEELRSNVLLLLEMIFLRDVSFYVTIIYRTFLNLYFLIFFLIFFLFLEFILNVN